MDHKVRETAEKIFVRTAVWDETEIRDCEDNILTREDVLLMNGTRWDGIEMAKLRLRKQANESIIAAKVFHGICGKDVVWVGK